MKNIWLSFRNGFNY